MAREKHQVTTWLTAAGITDGPLFRGVREGVRLGGALDGVEVACVFKAMVAAAGLSAADAAQISGHSTRVGDMVELPAIMQASG